VIIDGQSQARVGGIPGSITLNYRVILEDLEDLKQPLRISWSSDGHILNPTAGTTGIKFSYGRINPGQAVSKHVLIQVTDATGKTVQSSKSVTLFVSGPPGSPTNPCPQGTIPDGHGGCVHVRLR
jgi:hypothetical protein